jgi:hypothetical protein
MMYHLALSTYSEIAAYYVRASDLTSSNRATYTWGEREHIGADADDYMVTYHASEHSGRGACTFDAHVWTNAARVVAMGDASRWDTAAADSAAVVADMATLLRHSIVTPGAVGDFDTDRELHAYMHDKHDGDTPEHAPAPDYFDGVRHTVTRKRSRKGTTTTTVARRGTAFVIGAETNAGHDGRYTLASSRIVLPVARRLIEQYSRRGVQGRDGIGLARLASHAYDIPRLIGTDAEQKSEVIPEHICAQDIDRMRSYARHVDGETLRAQRVTRHATRYALPMPRKRTADPTPREHVEHLPTADVDARQWWHVIEHRGAADDVMMMFVGHRKVRRGATQAAMRKARVYLESVVIRADDDLPTVLAQYVATLPKGGAARWEWEGTGITGTVTVSASGRYNVRGAFDGETVIVVRSARTSTAVARQVARQLANA